MDHNEVHRVLREMKFMRELSGELRDKVASIFQAISEFRKVPLGKTWIREGEKSESKGYILVKGSVAIRKVDSQQHLEDAPELIGEVMQFNPAHARTASVVATEECAVLCFDWDSFWAKTKETLSDSDEKLVKTAVESFAWEHFTR